MVFNELVVPAAVVYGAFALSLTYVVYSSFKGAVVDRDRYCGDEYWGEYGKGYLFLSIATLVVVQVITGSIFIHGVILASGVLGALVVGPELTAQVVGVLVAGSLMALAILVGSIAVPVMMLIASVNVKKSNESGP